MANRFRGEVEFDVDGVTYRAVLGMPEVAALQDAYGIPGIGFQLVDARLKSFANMFTFGRVVLSVRGSHPEITTAHVGELLEARGDDNRPIVFDAFDLLVRRTFNIEDAPKASDAEIPDEGKAPVETASP